jgi:hypothetical protein
MGVGVEADLLFDRELGAVMDPFLSRLISRTLYSLTRRTPLPTHTDIVQQAGSAGENCDPFHMGVDPLEKRGTTYHVATVIAHYMDCPDTPREVVAQAYGATLQFCVEFGSVHCADSFFRTLAQA